MATLTIVDPVTRIEGHMKIEITVDTVAGLQQITDAKCSGTLFRGFELILNQRDPRDAPILTQRICGVCPVSHGMAATFALESAAGLTPPANARILRNLVLGANFVQSHILHFYLLAAPDFVAFPNSAPWSPAWTQEIRSGAESVATNLATALQARRRAHEMGAVFGGKMPHPHTYIPGGFTSVPSAAAITKFRSHLTWLRNFIDTVYIPDSEMVSSVYSDYHGIGVGYQNFISYGVFKLNDTGTSKLLKTGRIMAVRPATTQTLDLNGIREAVTYSWYQKSVNLHPSVGVTVPQYPKGVAYSWLKAPRYGTSPMEAGPLARMWVNGDYRAGVSVMDRHLARAQEAKKVADAMDGWLNQLVSGGSVYTAYSNPATGAGVGLNEAPRGAIGHWVSIANGKISQYQVITPTCWNASPRDSTGKRGPIEQALIGTPIANADMPMEALRVVHSFDPCLSCAVHVIRPNGKPLVLKAGIVR